MSRLTVKEAESLRHAVHCASRSAVVLSQTPELLAAIDRVAEPDPDDDLVPANDLCGGCGGERAGGRCSAGCGWGLSRLPDPTPVERALLTIAETLGIDVGLSGWLERVVDEIRVRHAPYRGRSGNDVLAPGPPLSSQQMLDDAARALGWRTDFACGDSPITWELVLAEIRRCARVDRDDVHAVLRERQAALTVAYRALASIAAGLKISDGPSADWVGDTTRAIRAAVSAQQAALRDIGAALGVEDEPLPTIIATAWEHAGYRIATSNPPTPRTDPATGQPMALPLAPIALRTPPGPPWTPAAGEIFHGHVRGVWYRMEWRGWYAADPWRASVRLIDPGPVSGDTLDDMRPLDTAPTSPPGDVICFTLAGDSVHGQLFHADRPLATGEGPFLALSSGQLPSGLAIATPYWVIARGTAVGGGPRFQLATSEQKARDGFGVDITTPGRGLHRLQRVAVPAGAKAH